MRVGVARPRRITSTASFQVMRSSGPAALHDRVGCEHTTGLGLREVGEPGSLVHRVPDDGVLQADRGPNRAGDHRTRGHCDADLHHLEEAVQQGDERCRLIGSTTVPAIAGPDVSATAELWSSRAWAGVSRFGGTSRGTNDWNAASFSSDINPNSR